MDRIELRHITLLDDPYGMPTTPEEKEKAQKWVDKTIKNRKCKDGPKIIVFPTRLHEDDETVQLTLDPRYQ
ncbi:hypothetical protein [Sunxiuqinia indica]|uniref:hypothetical protein n=1 Tax=Sunxiuqinia indica TaxID=2692584 RepID=UPI0013594B7D|nr:hypothetical protein [Sunxiuqinia indica]